MNDVAEEASSNNTEGLANAQVVLEALQQRTPDDADTGLNTALDQIERARNQAPETGQGGQPGGPDGSANPPM